MLFRSSILFTIAKNGLPYEIISAGRFSSVDIWAENWANDHGVSFRRLHISRLRRIPHLAFYSTHLLAFTNGDDSLRIELEESCEAFDTNLSLVSTKY